MTTDDKSSTESLPETENAQSSVRKKRGETITTDLLQELRQEMSSLVRTIGSVSYSLSKLQSESTNRSELEVKAREESLARLGSLVKSVDASFSEMGRKMGSYPDRVNDQLVRFKEESQLRQDQLRGMVMQYGAMACIGCLLTGLAGWWGHGCANPEKVTEPLNRVEARMFSAYLLDAPPELVKRCWTPYREWAAKHNYETLLKQP